MTNDESCEGTNTVLKALAALGARAIQTGFQKFDVGKQDASDD